MTLIEQKTLTQAMRMLDAIGCVYAIQDSNGAIHGTLQPSSTKKHVHPRGALIAHVKQHIPHDFGVGQVAYVPCAEFGNETMSRTCMSYMIKTYGSGSYKTYFDKTNNLIEVIRYF